MTRSVKRSVAAGLAVVALLAATPAATAAPRQAAGTLTWVGGNGPNWSTAANWSPQRAPLAGDTLVFPDTDDRSSTNDLAGLVLTRIQGPGALPHELSGNTLGLAGGIDGRFGVAFPIALAGGGPHRFGGNQILSGAISGTGPVEIDGDYVAFSGTTPNSYTGDTTVTAGRLVLSKSSGATSIPGGTLRVGAGGSAEVAAPDQIADGVPVTVGSPGGGTFAAGPTSSAESPPVYERLGPLRAGPGSVVDTARPVRSVAVAGLDLQAAEYRSFLFPDRVTGNLLVDGTVSLTGTRLSLTSPNGRFSSAEPVTVVANDGTDPVIGTFTGLPEGWVLNLPFADASFPAVACCSYPQVSYVGGDGNDVTLRRVGANELLVRLAYQFILARVPDAGGLVFWTGFLDQGGSPSGFTALLVASREGRQAAVRSGYTELLGRPPDSGGLQYWRSFLEGGGGVDAFRASLLGSAEYRSQPGHQTNAGFVDSLYRQPTVFGRDPDSGGRAYWAGRLDRGQLTRTQVALAFVDADEAVNHNADRALDAVYPEVRFRDPTEARAAYRQSHGDYLAVLAAVLA